MDGMFDSDHDDFDDDEMVLLQGDAVDTHMVTNSEDWPNGAWPLTVQDLAVTTMGLAANVTKALSLFFLDIRRDLAASRNNRVRQMSVQEFDDELLRLPAATE